MFGELSPRIPSLLVKANTWAKAQTFLGVATHSGPSLGTTTIPFVVLENATAAASGAQQVSPSIEWKGTGWASSGSVSRVVGFRSNVIGIQGTSAPSASWKLESSINNASYVTALEFLTTAVSGVDFPQLNVTGAIKTTVANSSTIDTLQNMNIVSSGSRVNVTHSFGSTIRSGWQTTDQGAVSFYSAGSGSGYFFKVGSGIGSQNDVLQIYSGGLYNYGSIFSQGRVTAGQADTTPPAYLNTYGSLALRGVFISTNTTLDENQTMVYVDGSSNNICTGTPSVSTCSSYTGSGEATCISHLPCTWNPAVTESCSTYGGIDQSTCEGQSGCTFDQASCGGASDQSSCEAQDDAFGGSCSWNACSGFGDISSCNGQSGCSASTGDCGSTFFDESSCLSQTGCSWDGSACSGEYFISCDGNYCAGSYYNGSCSGTHEVSAAACSGTVTCASYMSSGACAAETGCTWSSGVTITLPASSAANKGNTSRMYSIVNVGSSGVVTVVPTPGGTIPDSILGFGSGVVLNAQNERVMLHHHTLTTNCSVYNSNQSSCESTSGCSWSPAIVCADYSGDESMCNSHASDGCSYSEGICSGAGSASSCNGTFTASKPWIIHQLSN